MRVPRKEKDQSFKSQQQFKYCSHCGTKIDAEAVICPHCGVPVEGSTIAQVTSSDENSSGLNVLAFFFPVIGWILWAVWHNDYPIKSHNIAKWAWIGFGVQFAIGFMIGASGD